MKRTKEGLLHKTHFNSHMLFVLFALLILLGILSTNELSVNAANISVHNYVTNDTVQYSGVQVCYQVNEQRLDNIPPGFILSNGAAVGPFHEVFVTPLGAVSDYIDGKNTFTLSFGPHTIKMTLGSTEAIVNGIKCTMNNAPYVYSINGSSEKHLYVPTRFVAETFGFEYVWNAATSTASIKRANVIYDGKERINYAGIEPKFILNGNTISASGFPGYVFDNVSFFSAEEYFKNTGLASYAYSEGSGLIILKNKERMVRLVLDSPVAYINDTAYLLETVPRLITPAGSAKADVYVPAKFVAEALGYSVTYQSFTGLFRITGTLQESATPTPSPELSDRISLDTASYGRTLFSFKTHEQILNHFNDQGYLVPKEIAAYSCVNSDALYFKGVDSNHISITDKADVLEVVISGYHNPFQGKVNYTPEASFLNYCYVSKDDEIKIIIIKTKELHYYTYSAPDGCVIHFTDSYGMYQDYLKFNGASDSSDSDTTDIFSGVDISNYIPEAVFTRDHFVIRLPESIDTTAIIDSDEYEKKRFTISIPGNHMSFLSEQDTYNPIKKLNNVQFSYKVSNNTTVITFNTTKIQGYSFSVADHFLAVKIADPRDIYDKIIVLDAGHGGIDPGTLRGNIYEKNVNFNVINVYAPEYFKNSDIKVYYTRTTDTKIALQTRADFAATVGADLFISFHVNAHSNAAVNGTSVYYSASNNRTTASGLKSSLLATSVANHLSSSWGTSNKGILADKFVVIHKNTVPAVLVECGFITNNKDFEKIKDTNYQKKAAKALFDAVSEIFEKYPTGR